MEGNFHIFRKIKQLALQDSFIFVDTESQSVRIDDKKEVLNFKLGCAIFWKRLKNKKIERTYFDVGSFWNDVENFFSKKNKQILFFAHNTQFDFKMLDGFNELIKRDWNLKSFYIRNKTFIVIMEKVVSKGLKYTLHIWDTMNYVRKPLESLGKSLGIPKLKVDFETTSIEYLEIYCKRDTEIIYQFIKRLVEFLELHDLSRLRATAGSLSLNIFRHKFYNQDNENSRIYIHNWKRAIRLERESYRGGITDCFKVGSYNDLIKVDINSEYPYIMKKYKLPTKLLFNSHESKFTQEQLKKIIDIVKKKGYGYIAKITVDIPKESAYILGNYGLGKSSFVYGIVKISLCQPEIEFLLENGGKLITIHELSVYRMYNIFRDFVNFFYSHRVDYKKLDDNVSVEFCKLILNTQYGKWGQRDIEYKQLDLNNDFLIKNQDLIKLMVDAKKDIIRNNVICYLGTIVNECELYVIDKHLFMIKQLSINSKDSFVAISSYITSYARMLLVNYIKIAERENVYYSDTDSLVVNQIGYNNLYLNHCINEYSLGKLKIEGKGKGVFYAPKFYDFDNERKCKGIKLDSKLMKENNDFAKYEVELWQKHKSDWKKGISNEQIIVKTTKKVLKQYDKGKVDKYGNVIPFSIQEIEALI